MARIIDGNEMNMIGKNLRRLRIKKRLSQQALSDKLETMAIYVCRAPYPVLDKQRTVTDIELYGIAKALDVPITDLFEERNI